MALKVYLAVDLGAESGRVMAGLWNGKAMHLEEVHRFPNGQVVIGDSIRWDLLRLWTEVQIGFTLAGRKFKNQIVSIGADTWGVDFVLLNKAEEMLGLPYHYRDARTKGLLQSTFRKVPRQELFAQTGLQFMELNSLYQLIAWQKRSPRILEEARTLLFIPDFFNWAMCGVKVAEFTVASTSQFMHPLKRKWSIQLLQRLGLPTHFLPKIVEPGTILGSLRKGLAERTGLGKVKVVAPASHDTASAVVGVPTESTGSTNWAYISSGTWSLMGVETARAQVTPQAMVLNMTNEGGTDGNYRLLKNIMGMWLVQQCKRSFDHSGRHFDYAQLTRMASAAKPLRSLINPNDTHFLNPLDMPSAIQAFCRETSQTVPQTAGEIVRCALESLALKYRSVALGSLEKLTGQRIEHIHIVGGGSQNGVLNSFVADACERTVVAGPVEATAMGNLLLQARVDGELNNLTEIREVVRKSSKVKVFKPQANERWREAAARWDKLTSRD